MESNKQAKLEENFQKDKAEANTSPLIPISKIEPELEKKISLNSTKSMKNSKKKRKTGKPKKSKKSEISKNIHRQMVRSIIRALTDEKLSEFVRKFCDREKIPYPKLKSYFLQNIEFFTSLQLLKNHWNQLPQDNTEMRSMKRVFRNFSKWFIQERAIRYILKGKMENKSAYIDYKNRVMLKYINTTDSQGSQQI